MPFIYSYFRLELYNVKISIYEKCNSNRAKHMVCFKIGFWKWYSIYIGIKSQVGHSDTSGLQIGTSQRCCFFEWNGLCELDWHSWVEYVVNNHGCIDTMVVDYSVKGVTSVQASQKPLLMLAISVIFHASTFLGEIAHTHRIDWEMKVNAFILKPLSGWFCNISIRMATPSHNPFNVVHQPEKLGVYYNV